MAFNQNFALSGLTSIDTAVPTAGPYFVKGKIQLPTVTAGGGQSSCVVTVTNRTGPVTLYTGTAGADGFYLDTLCAAGDVIRIALTSAAAADAPLNVIKCEASIGSGQ